MTPPPKKSGVQGRVTLRDIALRLGISHVAVSLALKNNPRISAKRKEQVKRTALEMGYVPDPMLSSLIAYRNNRRTSTIHSALAWINHWEDPRALRKQQEFNSYWLGASEAAQHFGYRLDEFVWESNFTPKRMESILLARNIRGVLIPPHHTQPDWGSFHWDRFEVIRFGQSVRSPASHLVTSDQMTGVITAVEKMHEYGYQRIGFIVPEHFDLSLGGNHTGGFGVAQRALDLKHRLPPLLLQSEKTIDIVGPIRTWLTAHKPDAVLIAVNSVLEALIQLGIRVPEDLAVAGTSIADISADAGLDQNSKEIGRVAVESLIAMINGGRDGIPSATRRILVRSRWVDGASLPNREAKRQAA